MHVVPIWPASYKETPKRNVHRILSQFIYWVSDDDGEASRRRIGTSLIHFYPGAGFHLSRPHPFAESVRPLENTATATAIHNESGEHVWIPGERQKKMVN